MEPKSLQVGPDYAEGLISKMRTVIRKNPSPRGMTSEAARPAPSGGRLRRILTGSFHGDSSSGFQLLAIAAVLAGLAVWAVLTAWPVGAQDAPIIDYAENGEDAVATFTATDPEGVTPITWSVAPTDTIFDDVAGIAAADAADAEHFMIDDEDGILKFSSPPDFENPSGENATENTYKVVVVACDVPLVADACPASPGGEAGYHKVTVEVTNVNEPGKVTLVTSTDNGTPQYLVGAMLTATASDGDITNTTQTFVADVTGEVSGVTWRWYRGGTEITGAQDNTYTLLAADINNRIRAVAYYIVAGNVDQEMAEETTDYPVLAVRIGENQFEFDPAAVSRTISEGDKGRNVGAPVTATGNHGTVRYSLDAGDDAERFKIDDKTGQITTNVVLDYEGGAPATADDAGSCARASSGSPDRECTVTVMATDSTGESTSTTAPNFHATVTIMITDVDEKPDFSTAGAQTVSVPENSTALFGPDAEGYSDDAVGAVTYTAMDPEGLTVNYSLAGPDASKFQISDSPPVLSFVSGPDFEAKASADRDNVYEVTVRASVGGDTGERMVRVNVGNVDEGPDVSGPSTRNYAENGEDAVATFTATDPEGVTPITWSVAPTDTIFDDVAGIAAADAADAEHFMIDDEDGMLKFSSPPDFENPSGENATENTYKVVVVACDVPLVADACPASPGGEAGYHKVTVEVTNVNEPGKVTLVTSTDNGTPQYLVGAMLTATASDGDITNTTQTFVADVTGEVSGVTWRWYRGGTEITGADAQGNTYTLLAADTNNRIRVVVTYQVDGNTRQESASLTTDYPVLAVRIGVHALEFDPAEVSRTISEGAKGRNVGAPVTATGNHGTVRYSLDAGDDAERFKIDDKTGQITTNVVLDYEGGAPATADDAGSCARASSGSPDRECTVTVMATDSTGESTSTTAPNFHATVTIMITDVDEKPDFSTAGAQTVSVPENSTALFGPDAEGYSDDAVGAVTYTAMDPEGLTVNYSLAGPDASKFQISDSPPVLSFVSGPDFEAKASADRDNVYEVTVRASVGGDTGERMVKVTVGNVDEAPEIIQGGLGISGMASVRLAEDSMTTVGSYSSAGPDAASARWTLEGDDRMYFRVGTTRGAMTELMFRSAPDHEMPRGRAMSDTNTNTYMVILKANDGENTAMKEVTVMVTNVDEKGTVVLSSMTPVVGVELTATLTDPDGIVTGETWQWSKSMTMDRDYEVITGLGTTSDSYTPAEADEGYYLRATVSYTDGQGSGKSEMMKTSNAVVATDARDPLLAEYDPNDDGTIESADMRRAVENFFGPSPTLTRAEMRRLVGIYFG